MRCYPSSGSPHRHLSLPQAGPYVYLRVKQSPLGFLLLSLICTQFNMQMMTLTMMIQRWQLPVCSSQQYRSTTRWSRLADRIHIRNPHFALQPTARANGPELFCTLTTIAVQPTSFGSHAITVQSQASLHSYQSRDAMMPIAVRTCVIHQSYWASVPCSYR
jgi:hypothetical protein